MIQRIIERLFYPEYAKRDRSEDLSDPAYDIIGSGTVIVHEGELDKRIENAHRQIESVHIQTGRFLMIMISGPAGRRLARAKASIDAWGAENKPSMAREMAKQEFVEAAKAVADELIGSGHHEIEGD